MQNKLTMKYPSAWHGDMWREAAPFGNGVIGGMVYGGIYKENIMINHAALWRAGSQQELPDIREKLPEIRALLDQHKVVEADSVISDTLREKNYSGDFVTPNPLCDILIQTPSKALFSHYKREIDLSKAEVTVSWQEGEARYTRSTFVSRQNDFIFTKYSCENGLIDTAIGVALHDPETMKDVRIPNQENFCKDNLSFFAAENVSIYKPGDFGAVCRIFTDGTISENSPFVSVSHATEILIVTKVFIETPRKKAFSEITKELDRTFDYEEELQAHSELHRALFHKVDFSISDSHLSNEELLLEAFSETASNELVEKLYAYGRYLFICSTSDKNSLPCHLIGLFNGTYQCFWAFNMYNVNFEMIYWQALTGNLPSFLRLALDYTEALVPDFKENARKIFGCRGILINSVNAPDSGLYKCLQNHIVNWTGGAAWFSQHFFDYYRFTLDETYLREHALPFMYETALFYEDFVVENPDGYYDLYPSVSPENVASNIRSISPPYRNVEISKNATMEFALLKELLTNLLRGCAITGMYPEKQAKWKEMLSKIRPYMVNEDGAIKEWMDDHYKDNYHHRHHSHLYPVFPGCEITKDDPLYPAFVKAEDLRLAFGLSDQSSWSMVFMAGIAARMERGNFALTLINTMAKTCLMGNLFTVHNDWRRMGPVACADFRIAPFQIDGNIGIPGIINEMLLQSQQENIFILPALPDKWEHGHINGLLARGNILCDIAWNQQTATITLHSDTPMQKEICLGSGYLFEDGADKKTVSVTANTLLTVFKKEQ